MWYLVSVTCKIAFTMSMGSLPWLGFHQHLPSLAALSAIYLDENNFGDNTMISSGFVLQVL